MRRVAALAMGTLLLLAALFAWRGDPEGPAPGPILLQNHSDRVRYRNV